MTACLNVSLTASYGKYWMLNISYYQETDSNIRKLCKIFVDVTRTTESSKEEMATEEGSTKSETDKYGRIKSQ